MLSLDIITLIVFVGILSYQLILILLFFILFIFWFVISFLICYCHYQNICLYKDLNLLVAETINFVKLLFFHKVSFFFYEAFFLHSVRVSKFISLLSYYTFKYLCRFHQNTLSSLHALSTSFCLTANSTIFLFRYLMHPLSP